MGRPQVFIRVGMAGQADINRGFAQIADDGSAQASRLRAKWESETALVSAAVDRAAKTAARLSQVSATPAQQTINQAVGIGSGGANAEASAKALAAELDRAEKEAHALIAAIDPLFAAQARYTAQVERINAVRRTGQVDEARYQQLLAHEKVLLDEATQAAARNNATRAQTRAGFQQLSFQFGDIAQQVALGTRYSVIFAQQSGQVIQAMQLMGGEGNAFLKFLGGPWGLALSIAVQALVPFAGKMIETKDAIGDEVDKLKEQEQKTRLSAEAQLAFERTIDGSIAKMRELTKELEAQNRTLEDNIALKKAAIATGLASTTSNIGIVSGQLSAAIDDLHRYQTIINSPLAGGEAQQAAQQMFDATKAQVDSLNEQLRSLTKASEDGAKALRSVDFPLLERHAKELTDPIAKINRLYDDMATKAKAAASGNDKLKASLSATLDDIEKRRKADLDAAKATGGYSNRESGRQISASDAAGIARAAGLQVNSADRSYDHQKQLYDAWVAAGMPKDNPVAKPGTSAHEGANGKWAIDIQITDGVTPAKIRQIYGAQGVSLSKVFKERGHFHIEGSRSDAAGAERAEDQAANRARDAQTRFDDQLAGLNAQLLRAEGENVKGAQAQAALRLRQIDQTEAAQVKAIANDLADGKYGEATSALAQERAKQLTAVVHQTATQDKINLGLDGYLRWLSDRDATASQQAGIQLDQKRFEDSIARTTDQHRRLQLDIVNLIYEEKKRHLEYLKAQAELVGNTAEAARLQGEINDLPRQQANDTRAANDNTRGPLEDYLNRMPKSAGDINERVQALTVDELESVRRGIDDAITKSLGIKDPLLAGLIDLFVQQVIIRPIAQALQGAMGGAGGGGGGLFGSLLGIGASLFGGSGAGAASFGTGVFQAGNAGAALGAFPTLFGSATGTEYAPGGLQWVGENGRELINLPRGSKVLNAATSRRLEAANDRWRMPAGDTYHINVRVAGDRRSSAAESRRTGMHIGAGVRQSLAMTSRKGLIGGGTQ
jgi:hypothetical protein